MQETPTYNATNAQVHPPQVDAAYVASLRERMRAARANFRAASSRFDVPTAAQLQLRAR